MKAFFFDRDGTLNIDTGYINNPDNMTLFPGAVDILKYIKSLGYKIFIISNQSGIGRGLIKAKEYRKVNERFLSLAGGHNIIDDILYCPHSPILECVCRKPKTLLLEIIKEIHDIDFNKSFFVGDKITDIICGRILGLGTIMISDGKTHNEDISIYENHNCKPDKIIKAISELSDIIKG